MLFCCSICFTLVAHILLFLKSLWTETAELLFTLLLLCSWTAPLLQLLLQYLLCSCAGITLRPLGLSPFSSPFFPLLLLLDSFSASPFAHFFFLNLVFCFLIYAALLQSLLFQIIQLLFWWRIFKFLCNRQVELMMREQNGNYHVILVLFRCLVIKDVIVMFMVNIFLFFLLIFFNCKLISIFYTLYFSNCSMAVLFIMNLTHFCVFPDTDVKCLLKLIMRAWFTSVVAV